MKYNDLHKEKRGATMFEDDDEEFYGRFVDDDEEDFYNRFEEEDEEFYNLIKENVEEEIFRNLDKYQTTEGKKEYILKLIRDRDNRVHGKMILMLIEELEELGVLEEGKKDFLHKVLLGEDEYYLDFSQYEIAKIIKLTNDAEYIKSVIEKEQEYGLFSDNIAELLSRIYDIEYVVNCIKKFGNRFDRRDRQIAMRGVRLEDVIEYVNKKQSFNTMKNIKLPKDITIGIEIESIGLKSKQILDYEELIDGWKTTEEYSYKNGVEVKAPVMKCGEDYEKEIYEVCSILKTCGNYCNGECGGHVHIKKMENGEKLTEEEKEKILEKKAIANSLNTRRNILEDVIDEKSLILSVLINNKILILMEKKDSNIFTKGLDKSNFNKNYILVNEYKETKNILAYIFLNYLATKEEKEIVTKKLQKDIMQAEMKKREKYPTNVFERNELKNG